jgi:formate-dependent nitrite reductase cytochrome c552 subunit
MNMRMMLVLTAVVASIGLSYINAPLLDSAHARDVTALPSVTTQAIALVGDKFEYVGSSKCKMCHMKQHKSWKKTKMALAINTLKPDHAVEVKKKFNLDPTKDNSQNKDCLECHTTGFGKAGGYAMPDPADKKAVKKANKMAGVGCESCHGPGSAYIKIHMDLLKTRRKYNVQEMYDAGMTKIDANACSICHNEKSPTIEPGKAFDYEAMKEQGTHEHYPLKQRE